LAAAELLASTLRGLPEPRTPAAVAVAVALHQRVAVPAAVAVRELALTLLLRAPQLLILTL
jgi:hypothetical protein